MDLSTLKHSTEWFRVHELKTTETRSGKLTDGSLLFLWSNILRTSDLDLIRVGRTRNLASRVTSGKR